MNESKQITKGNIVRVFLNKQVIPAANIDGNILKFIQIKQLVEYSPQFFVLEGLQDRKTYYINSTNVSMIEYIADTEENISLKEVSRGEFHNPNQLDLFDQKEQVSINREKMINKFYDDVKSKGEQQ